jgi:hypothetical protein
VRRVEPLPLDDGRARLRPVPEEAESPRVALLQAGVEPAQRTVGDGERIPIPLELAGQRLAPDTALDPTARCCE